MLSSPDRDDDELQARLRALHDHWPGDPWDDDPLREVRRSAPAAPRPASPGGRLRRAWRALTHRLGASDAGLLLPEARTPDPDAPR